MALSTPLVFTQGDQVVLNLTALQSGVPVDLTSAVFSTQIRGPNQTIVTFGNSQHTANPDQTNFKGKFTLSLSSTDTASLLPYSGLEILTQILIAGSNPIYFHGFNILTVLQNIPAI